MNINLRKITSRMAIGTLTNVERCLAYCLIGTLVSCVTEDYHHQQPPVAVQFTTSVVADSLASPDRMESGSGASPTRAYNDTWEPGDEIGIFMLATSGSDASFPGTSAGNHLYTVSNAQDTKTGSLVPATDTDTFYYPMDGSDVRFVAYSPYRTSALLTQDGGHYYHIDVSSSTPQVLSDVDLIYHSGEATGIDGVVPTYNKSSQAVPLTFEHQLSKVTVVVHGCDGISAADLDLTADPMLYIDGMPTTAIFDLSHNSYAGLGGTDATIVGSLTAASDATAAIWEAIVVPHTNPGLYDRTFTFTFGGDTYTSSYTLMSGVDNYNFLPGTAYVYNFLLTAKGIELKLNTIVDWNAGLTTYDGNLLMVSTSAIAFTAAGSTATVTVKTTDLTGTVTAKASTSATEVNSASTWLNTPTVTAVSTANGWKTWTVNLTANRWIYSTARATNYLMVQIGGQTCPITVTQAAGEGVKLAATTPTSTSVALTGTYVNKNTIKFYTNSSVKPDIRYATSSSTAWASASTSLPDGLKQRTALTGAAYTTSGYNDTEYTWTYDYTSNPSAIDSRAFYVLLRVVDNGTTVDLKYTLTQVKRPATTFKTTKTADGLSNCYIVAPNDTIVFPVARAYANTTTTLNSATLRVGGTYDGATATNKWKVEELWNESSTNIYSLKVEGSGQHAMITVIAGATAGNALIALQNSVAIGTTHAANTTLWSYHIWVNSLSNITRYPLGATGTSSAAMLGLYYQFGRKDPFQRITSQGNTARLGGKSPALTAGISAANADLYPTTQITDWSSSNYKRWGGNSDDKQVTDPCPPGYVVGQYTDWDQTLSYTTGYAYTTSATNREYHPFGGWVDTSGTVNAVGTTCYYHYRALNPTDMRYHRIGPESSTGWSLVQANPAGTIFTRCSAE